MHTQPDLFVSRRKRDHMRILYERLGFTRLLFIFNRIPYQCAQKPPNTEVGTFYDKNTLHNTVKEP